MSLSSKGKRLERLERLERLRGPAARPVAEIHLMPDGRTFRELTDAELHAELERMKGVVAANRRERPPGRDPAFEAWVKSLSDEELEAEVAKAAREASRG